MNESIARYVILTLAINIHDVITRLYIELVGHVPPSLTHNSPRTISQAENRPTLFCNWSPKLHWLRL